MNDQRRRARFVFLAALVGMGFLALFLRLVVLQILEFPALSREAKRQQLSVKIVEPRRGSVLDRHETVLAINRDAPSLFADPYLCADMRKTAQALASVLKLDLQGIERKLSSSKRFVWIKRKVDADAAQRLHAMSLGGVGMILEGHRMYPHGPLLAHVLGFAGLDGHGLEGVEWRYDHDLRGRPGQLRMERDALGATIFSEALDDRVPSHGHDIVLTIDANLQYIVETALDEAIHTTRAKGGSVIMMDPHTGEILAMTSRPSFDPNAIRRFTPHHWRNRTITDPYEPGSTFKIVAAAAALNEATIDPHDLIFAENGRYEVAQTVVHDLHPMGWVSVAQIIERSSNIGIVKIAQRLSEERFYQYLRAFGFGARTGVDLGGESPGILRPRIEWEHRSLASIAMGHELAVTPLQLITAAAVIANGGWLMQPYVVSEIRNAEGRLITKTTPRVRGKPITARTAELMTEILERVVTHGTGTNAGIPGYRIAGKTGTAQKFDSELGQYSNEKYVASFFGFLPAPAPRVIALVIIDEPQTASWGGAVAAPVFRSIAERAIPYWRILPETPMRTLVASRKNIVH